MKRKQLVLLAVASASVLAAGVSIAAQDRFSLKSPNGISFSEFRGYQKWQLISSAMPDNAAGCGSSPEPGCIKSITGNAIAIKAYADGIPANGKPVPDGAMYAKIEWQKKHITEAYPVTIPGKFVEVAFMVKDSKRFPKTNGWGYATLTYDEATGQWSRKGDNDPDFGRDCHACHTVVRARDYLFTAPHKY